MPKDIHKIAEASARGGIFLVFGAIFTLIGYAISSVIVARLLGPETYGLYTLSLVITQMLFLLSDLGINQGLIKFCAGFLEQGKTENIKKLVKHAIILKIIFALFLFLINFFFADFFALNILRRPELTVHVQLASFSILFEVVYLTTNSVFIGIEKTEYATVASGIQSAARAIISIILVLAGFSIAGAVLGYVGGFAVGAMIASSILFQFLSKYPSNNNTDMNFSKNTQMLIKYGIPIYFSVIFIGLIPPYQSLLLAFFSTNFEIGNFKASYNFITLINMVTIQITNALMPAFSRLCFQKKEETKTFFEFANKYTTMLVLPIAMFFIVFSKEIIQLMYGPVYESAASFLSMNSSLYLFVGLGYLTVSSLFNGLGRTGITLKASLITFLIVLILSPFLISLYQIPGLIFASIIAYFISTVYAYKIAMREYNIKTPGKQLISIYILSAVSTVPPLMLRSLEGQLSGVFIMSLEIILYLIIYSTLLPATRIIDNSEIDKAKKVVERIKPLSLIVKPLFKYQKFIIKKFSRI